MIFNTVLVLQILPLHTHNFSSEEARTQGCLDIALAHKRQKNVFEVFAESFTAEQKKISCSLWMNQEILQDNYSSKTILSFTSF